MPCRPLAGRTAIVTGAAEGLGRAEAEALGELGACVVVNDVNERVLEVAEELNARCPGSATTVLGDVGDWDLGDRLVGAAVSGFGSLDIVVNNAGIIRDTLLFNLTEAQWDDVIRVHLKGHASLSRAAAAHWRAQFKQSEQPVDASIVNTSSEAFLIGGAGQPNYGAAKAGIVALTLSTGQALARYGVRANAVCPRARTSMTSGVFGPASTGDDDLAPEHVARFVGYLAAPESAAISGQVFIVHGTGVSVLEPPRVERRFEASGAAFSHGELADQLGGYWAERDPDRTFAAWELLGLPITR